VIESVAAEKLHQVQKRTPEDRPDGPLLKGLLLRIALPGILTIALFIATAFGFFIPLLENNMMQGRKDTTQELAHSVWTLLQSYAEMVPEQATLYEAQASAIYHIRQLRYGPEGKDYFWINDMHPTMIMHPYRTELEGTDVSDYQDPNGVNLFVEFVKTVENQKSGFVEYQWWWQDSERVEDKISFIRGFEPWGWVVGTGLYLDDVKAEISLLKNRMVTAASLLIVVVGLLVLFMTRQRFVAEKSRVIAENTLRQSEQKFRGIFNNANHFAWILDSEGHLLEANETALKTIEESRVKVIGMQFEETVWWNGSGESREQLREIIKQCRTGVVGTGEVEQIHPDLSTHSVIIWASPIFDEVGHIVRMLVEGWDITDRRNLEDQLRQSQKMEAIGQLAGGIAHDFNNLLSGILGNADFLQNSNRLTGDDRECLKQIILASERSAVLTRQLLSFSRKGQLQNTAVNIHDLIGEVIALLSRSIDRRIKISRDLQAKHPFVDGDPSMLQNALLNLGVNARDAMSKAPSEAGSLDELTFSSTEVYLDKESAGLRSDELKPGWYIQVCVRDTGCGMTPQVLDRVFEPFFTTKEVGKGTGLGLASSYGCMKTHNGSLAVESEPMVGTSFTIMLPRSINVSHGPATEEVHVAKDGGTILFVDDDEILRQIMVRTLKRLGYEVVTCNDGVEAIEYYENNHHNIDLIILDLIMSRMGGEVAFRHLMEINPQARILISSGFARNHSVEELIRQGACGFLGKPYKISELSAVLAAHISG
jgi:PAS domain S-box-containing protein